MKKCTCPAPQCPVHDPPRIRTGAKEMWRHGKWTTHSPLFSHEVWQHQEHAKWWSAFLKTWDLVGRYVYYRETGKRYE